MKKQTKDNAKKITLDTVRSSALRMIARRDFFIQEIKDKLTNKFPGNPDEIEKIIQEFIESKWLSDKRFAKEFIRVKTEYSGWGPYKISHKLKEKGVASEIISNSIEEELPPEKILSTASNLAQEKWKLLHKKKTAERTAAVQRFLASRGFDYATITLAIKSLKISKR